MMQFLLAIDQLHTQAGSVVLPKAYQLSVTLYWRSRGRLAQSEVQSSYRLRDIHG
jgi:hypothetical protein